VYVFYGQNLSEELPEVWAVVRKTKGPSGVPRRTKAGMSLKGNDMLKCYRPIEVSGQGGGRDFALGDAGKQTQEA